MTVLATSTVLADLVAHRIVACPFCNLNSTHCGASSAIDIDENRRKKYCNSEDYEDCPIFLVRNMLGIV